MGISKGDFVILEKARLSAQSKFAESLKGKQHFLVESMKLAYAQGMTAISNILESHGYEINKKTEPPQDKEAASE